MISAKCLGTGADSYAKRQTFTNVGESRFEKFCDSRGFKVHRLGFDEKNSPVDHFYNLSAYVRNLPDFVVTTPSGVRLVNVKGTANIKEKEFLMIPDFIRLYETARTPLLYAFAFANQDPVFITAKGVAQLYEAGVDKRWPDGVVYRTLDINKR